MTWPDNMPSLGRDALGPFTPEEVLYQFEVPCIFTTRSREGGVLLTYLVEELEDDGYRYIAATTTSSAVEDLKSGRISVREALTQGWMWVVDTDLKLSPQDVRTVDPSRLPKDALPAADTMLWSSLEPEFRVHLVGKEVQQGSIPALVFGQSAEMMARALKSVFEHTAKPLLPESTGRPPEWLRSLYNLPTQRVAYGSLELAFRRPDLPTADQLELELEGLDEPAKKLQEVLDEGWTLLGRGLEWAANKTDLETQNDDERLAILESLKHLAPNASGPVALVEVSGVRIGGPGRVWKLDREASKRIRSSLSQLKRERRMALEIFTGKIRDLDLDKLTFILREVSDRPTSEVPFVIGEDQLLELALEAFYQELPVTVLAKSPDKRKWTATEMEFAEPEPEEDE
jgi:hypothetical protein